MISSTVGLRHLGEATRRKAVAAFAVADKGDRFDRIALRFGGGASDPQIHLGGGIRLIDADVQDRREPGAVREHRGEYP